MTQNRRRIATLLIGLIAMMTPMLTTAAPAHAMYWRPYVNCTGYTGGACWNKVFVEVPYNMYCSSSTGCFTYKVDGRYRNYQLRNLDSSHLTSAQWNCIAGIVVSGAAFFNPPLKLALAGAAVTVWGCAYW